MQRAWVMASGSVINEAWLPLGQGGSPPPMTPTIAFNHAPEWPTVDNDELPDAMLSALEVGEQQLIVEIGTPLAEIEQRVILATYERCGGQKERTAALLGIRISMKTLYNWLKAYQS